MTLVTEKEFADYRSLILEKYNYSKLTYQYQENDTTILCFLGGICISKQNIVNNTYMIFDITKK